MRLRHIRLRPTRTPAVVLALVVATSLTACSGGDKQSEVKKLTAAEQLASAKAKADAATSLHLTLRSSGIPETANGVLAADGSGTHAPWFLRDAAEKSSPMQPNPVGNEPFSR